MAAKLETLTPEQEALAEEVAAEYIADLTRPTPPDTAVVERWLDIVYSFYDRKRPPVEIEPSPHAALLRASELTGEKQLYTDYCGIGESGWVSFYDYFRRAGILSEDEAADVLALRDFARVAWDTVLLDDLAIVVRRPDVLKVDDNGNLHSSDGPAVAWADGEKEYAWHGTWVSERIVMQPRSFTREEYLAITNTEERRALSESAGWTWVAQLLGVSEVDVWTDSKTDLAYTLLRCSDGTQLLRKQSPPLKDGSQPTYLEPVHESLRTARGARKWQAVAWTPERCDRDPALSYGIER